MRGTIWSAPAFGFLLIAAAPPVAREFDTTVAAARVAMMVNPSAALEKAHRAIDLASNSQGLAGNKAKLATALWLEGDALTRLNRAKEALPILGNAYVSASRPGSPTHLRADIVFSLGTAEAALGQVASALARFQSAHTLFRATGDLRGEAKCLLSIGGIYSDAGDYERGLDYYRQTAEIYAGDPMFALAVHNNLGETLRKLGRTREAAADYGKAFAIARTLGSTILQARVLTNLASNELQLGELELAERHAQTAVILTATGEAAGWRPYAWGILAQVALARGDVASAADYLDKTFAGTDLATTSLSFRDFHQTAFKVYRKLGRPELALAHLEAFKRLDDEARNLASSANAALMSAQFDYANQNLKIARLKQGELTRDALIAQSRVRLHNIVLDGLGAAGTIILVLLMAGFLSLRRSRNEVRAANAELSAANLSLEDALKVKTEFLATTSHEIRTPLNGILGMTEVILADPKVEAAMREKLDLVHAAGLTMRALVDDILDVAKIETGNLTIVKAPMDLAALLRDTSQLWRGQALAKSLILRTDVADAPVRIIEDEGRLRQVLFNLMSNALKFTDHGCVTLRACVEGDRLRFDVRDTGIGIPAASLETIFESFRQADGGTTRRHSGTGLGLTICRSLIEAMGGTIRVESAPGDGACFTVLLPLTRLDPEHPAASAGPKTRRRANALSDACLMVIDANPLSQSLLRKALEPKVRELRTARNPDEALDLLATAGADLVLADGATLGAEEEEVSETAARLAVAGVPLHLLIVAPAPEYRSALLNAGVEAVHAKPIGAAALAVGLATSFAPFVASSLATAAA